MPKIDEDTVRWILETLGTYADNAPDFHVMSFRGEKNEHKLFDLYSIQDWLANALHTLSIEYFPEISERTKKSSWPEFLVIRCSCGRYMRRTDFIPERPEKSLDIKNDAVLAARGHVAQEVRSLMMQYSDYYPGDSE